MCFTYKLSLLQFLAVPVATTRSIRSTRSITLTLGEDDGKAV